MINAISSINSYVSRFLLTNYSKIQSLQQKSLRKLAMGTRINTASDDPAGLAISERLRSIIYGTNSAISNIQNTINYSTTSDSYLQTTHNMLGRMRELAISANDGTKSESDRRILQIEFKQMQEGIKDITSGVNPLGQFNGVALFQGEEVTVQIASEGNQTISLDPIDMTVENTDEIGIDSDGNSVSWNSILSSDGSGISLNSQESASQALEAISIASDHLSAIRVTIGAQQSRLTQGLDSLRNYQMNLVMLESKIRDLDVAREVINLMKYTTLGSISQNLIGISFGMVSLVG